MNKDVFQTLYHASYPCYWLAASGELLMNKAARERGEPFSDEGFMRKVIGEEISAPGEQNPAMPRRAFMPAGALSLQEFTIMPADGGTLCVFTMPRDEATLNFSRQLREPLADIFAVLPGLAAGRDKRDVERLEVIQEKCYRLLRITSNMESLSRMEKGSFRVGIINLSDFLQDVGESVALLSKRTGIRLKLKISEKGMLVNANQRLLSDAVLNILRNSYQYTREGNMVTLAAKTVGRQALITISDKGLGIRPENLEKIFNPYFSCDPYGDNPEKPGLGLGLTVARLVAQNIGGTITAQSEYGQGTTISLSIPLYPEGAQVLESDAADYVSNRFSPVYVHLEGFIRLPQL